jgi:hypothetical protein
MPFTFVFSGSFFDLEHLFRQLTDFATLSGSGSIQVSGRLLTIQSVQLAPGSSSGSTKGGSEQLTGTINATAYVLPSSQGLTGGATTAAPVGVNVTAPRAAARAATTPAVIGANR